jgi:hypothetical protein
MDTTENVEAKKDKKEFRKLISAKLETSLNDFQNGIKEKKFKAAVKRASKLLANDLFTKSKKDKDKKKDADQAVEAENIGA